MAIYVLPFTVKANTPEESPFQAELKLEETLITRFELHFPDGCAGMVKVRVFYGIKQIYPKEEGTYFSGNDETISFREHFRGPSIPWKLRVVASSPDTRYDHSLILRLGTLPEEVAAPGIWLKRLVDAFRRLIGLRE